MKKQLQKACLTLILAIGFTSTSFATQDTVAVNTGYYSDMQGNVVNSLTTNVGDTVVITNWTSLSLTFVINTTTVTSVAPGAFITYKVTTADIPNFNITATYMGMGSTVLTVNVNSITTGIADNINKVQFNAFPNPAKDLLILKSTNVLGTVKVYSITGNLVFTEMVKDNETNIDVSAFSPGMYFVETILNEKRSVSKLIKE